MKHAPQYSDYPFLLRIPLICHVLAIVAPVILFVALLSFFPIMCFAMNEGFNFRATQGFVTDPPDTQFVGVSGFTYPVTNDGVTFGWDSTTGLQSRDRSASVDPRIAGLVFRSVGTSAYNDFRVDLPAPGTYEISLALGDMSFTQTGNYAEIYDGSTLLATVNAANVSQPAGKLFDITGTLYPVATFLTDQETLSFPFSTTELVVRLGTLNAGSGNDLIVHLNVASVASEVPARILRLKGGMRLKGGIRLR